MDGAVPDYRVCKEGKVKQVKRETGNVRREINYKMWILCLVLGVLIAIMLTALDCREPEGETPGPDEPEAAKIDTASVAGFTMAVVVDSVDEVMMVRIAIDSLVYLTPYYLFEVRGDTMLRRFKYGAPLDTGLTELKVSVVDWYENEGEALKRKVYFR